MTVPLVSGDRTARALCQSQDVQLTCAGRTDAGRARARNEDAFLERSESGVFIVADGMGGHAAGEVAAQMAVSIVGECLAHVDDLPNRSLTGLLSQAISDANSQIYQRSVADLDMRGMGTTVTAMALRSGHYFIGHVGDSRAYVLRSGELRRITKDHSWVQEQVDAGYLTPEQAQDHPYSNVITRCVGVSDELEPDLHAGEAFCDDVFLLASDGLTGMVIDEEIRSIMMSHLSPTELADNLIDAANESGGLDNIAVVVVRVDEVE